MRIADTPSTVASTRVACPPIGEFPYVGVRRSMVIVDRGGCADALLGDAIGCSPSDAGQHHGRSLMNAPDFRAEIELRAAAFAEPRPVIVPPPQNTSPAFSESSDPLHALFPERIVDLLDVHAGFRRF